MEKSNFLKPAKRNYWIYGIPYWVNMKSIFRKIPKSRKSKKRIGFFTVKTKQGDQYTAKNILLAIGRRGTPRKLNVPGEQMEKVAYRLLEPEHISNKKILIVGGGDSAIESALLLAEENQVVLSYRSDAFSRLKLKNRERIEASNG